jgi:hypothetical protein
MRALLLVSGLLLWWIPASRGAVDKAVLELAPTMAELGNGWTTNQLILVIDPLGKPPEEVSPRHPDPEKLLKLHRQMMESSGRTGYLRIHYGHGDLVVNRGAYHVYLQRWANAEVLRRQHFQEGQTIDRRIPEVGQAGEWKRTEMYDSLIFRHDPYLVIIEFGRASDYTLATRLAEVIDAKIMGRSIQKLR